LYLILVCQVAEAVLVRIEVNDGSKAMTAAANREKRRRQCQWAVAAAVMIGGRNPDSSWRIACRKV
jgi:hypothetical protein